MCPPSPAGDNILFCSWTLVSKLNETMGKDAVHCIMMTLGTCSFSVPGFILSERALAFKLRSIPESFRYLPELSDTKEAIWSCLLVGPTNSNDDLRTSRSTTGGRSATKPNARKSSTHLPQSSRNGKRYVLNDMVTYNVTTVLMPLIYSSSPRSTMNPITHSSPHRMFL